MSAYEVIVVGAGPAGMSAASAAAEAGCRVCLLDDNQSTGGQIWRRALEENGDSLSHGKEFQRCVKRLRHAQVEIRNGTRVVAQTRSGSLRVERENSWSDLHYERLILATGA